MTASTAAGTGSEQSVRSGVQPVPASLSFFPQRAPIDEQLRWAVHNRDLARYRMNAWKHRHASLSALVRRLRREAAVPDAPEYEYEDEGE